MRHTRNVFCLFVLCPLILDWTAPVAVAQSLWTRQGDEGSRFSGPTCPRPHGAAPGSAPPAQDTWSVDTATQDHAQKSDQKIRITWTNSLRYNWGMRMQGRDPRIAGNAFYDQGDALFDRYDTISNRLDWLSEFELGFRRRYGLRATAAAWFNTTYGTQGARNPDALGAAVAPLSYINGAFTTYVKRYYRGPWAELLDAFIYGAFDVGKTVVNIKVGRHAVVWGESLFGSAHAVAYSQTPSDGMKAIANPGASAKETALPFNQLSVLAQISPAVSLLAQWGFEWRPNRIAEGGTYFGADGTNQGPNVNRLPPIQGRGGDVGWGVHWRPSWLDGMMGFYVRRFADKGGWLAQSAGDGNSRAVYARGVSLWGVTLAKIVGGSSIGMEISRRSRDPLVSDGAASAGPARGYSGATGDTWHGLINSVSSLGPSPLWRSAVLSAELTWSRLERVTQNPELYRARGYLSTCESTPTMRGCADRTFLSFALSFVPSWLQACPGVDLEMPVFVTRNVHGNAPSNGGGSEGVSTFKIGVTAKVHVRHQFDLAYTFYDQRLERATDTVFGSRVLGAPVKDKAWLSFTYQVAF